MCEERRSKMDSGVNTLFLTGLIPLLIFFILFIVVLIFAIRYAIDGSKMRQHLANIEVELKQVRMELKNKLLE
jgi:sensor domain CHASE-containing protein